MLLPEEDLRLGRAADSHATAGCDHDGTAEPIKIDPIEHKAGEFHIGAPTLYPAPAAKLRRSDFQRDICADQRIPCPR
jgi:hypothetical protein